MFDLSINGETFSTDPDEAAVIRLESADDTEWCCTACGAALVEDSDGFTDESGSPACPDAQRDTEPSEPSEQGRHRPERVALSWANSAAIHTAPDTDEITVTISVGDPRGALAFTVRRIPHDAPSNAGRLVLHTPHPGEPGPHVGLTDAHPGTYWLN